MSLDNVFLNATVAPDTTLVNSTMDWLMSKVDQFPIKLSFFFACSMVLGSVVPYIPQYFTIKQSQNTEGFSLYVCLTLLVANILRIMFWFGKHFETALLIQSIVMILAMFGLLELCVRVRNSNLIIQGRRHYFVGGEPNASKEKVPIPLSGDTQAIGPIGDIDGQKVFVNNAIDEDSLLTKSVGTTADEDEQLRAVSNNTVSSTVIDHVVIPNPHSILTHLPNATSDHSARSQAAEATDVTAAPATPATNSSTVSLSSGTTSSTATPPTKRSTTDTFATHSATNPKNLCAATLSSSASSVSECPVVAVSERTKPKQNDANETSSQEAGDTKRNTPVVSSTNYCCDTEDSGVEGTLDGAATLLNGSSNDLASKDNMHMATVKYSINATDDERVQLEYSHKPDHQVVTVLASASDEPPSKRHFLDFDLRYFWEWTDFISYLECMAIFAFVTGLVMFFLVNQPVVVETYGLVALVTESLLASPQFYRNWKAKSTEGMSRMMVFSWLLGDLYKTIYFVVRAAPFQFLLCGFTQITFDCLIFVQILWYKKANYRKLAKSSKLGLNQVTPTFQESDVKSQDAHSVRLKARHVSFSSPEVSQTMANRDDEQSTALEDIAMHKLD